VTAALTRRRDLRRASTDGEAALWRHLRARQLAGFKFRRQHPVGWYVLDFYCCEARLAVELDGGQHLEPAVRAYDECRTAFLRRRRIKVLRFATDLVFREPVAVLAAIARALDVGPPSP
jgi:very-short-patch-repair endonuclease